MQHQFQSLLHTVFPSLSFSTPQSSTPLWNLERSLTEAQRKTSAVTIQTCTSTWSNTTRKVWRMPSPTSRLGLCWVSYSHWLPFSVSLIVLKYLTIWKTLYIKFQQSLNPDNYCLHLYFQFSVHSFASSFIFQFKEILVYLISVSVIVFITTIITLFPTRYLTSLALPLSSLHLPAPCCAHKQEFLYDVFALFFSLLPHFLSQPCTPHTLFVYLSWVVNPHRGFPEPVISLSIFSQSDNIMSAHYNFPLCSLSVCHPCSVSSDSYSSCLCLQ